jgi:hypothetical protein
MEEDEDESGAEGLEVFASTGAERSTAQLGQTEVR